MKKFLFAAALVAVAASDSFGTTIVKSIINKRTDLAN